MLISTPMRQLALLWRANEEPTGCQIHSTEDVSAAGDLRDCGLGSIEKRRPLPHQLPMFAYDKTDYEDLWVTYFVPNDRAFFVWQKCLSDFSSLVRAEHVTREVGISMLPFNKVGE